MRRAVGEGENGLLTTIFDFYIVIVMLLINFIQYDVYFTFHDIKIEESTEKCRRKSSNFRNFRSFINIYIKNDIKLQERRKRF